MQRLVSYLVNSYRKMSRKPLKSFLIKIHNLYKLSQTDKIVTATIDGINYELDLNEMIDSTLYFAGQYEKGVTTAINKLCKPGMVVLDIGANVGIHTLRFAKLVGEKGQVYAFEPTSWAYNKLLRNASLNNFKNLVNLQVGISDSNKKNVEVEFYSSWPIKPKHDDNISPIHGGRIIAKDTIDLITMDTFVSENQINKVDLIKLDVDGYEYKVLMGSLELLKRDKPILFLELDERTITSAGDNIIEMITLLSDLGYEFYEDKSMNKIDFDYLKKELLNGWAFNSILSTHSL